MSRPSFGATILIEMVVLKYNRFHAAVASVFQFVGWGNRWTYCAYSIPTVYVHLCKNHINPLACNVCIKNVKKQKLFQITFFFVKLADMRTDTIVYSSHPTCDKYILNNIRRKVVEGKGNTNFLGQNN